MVRSVSERVAVFIDVQNLYYGAKDEYKGKVNYSDLMDYALDGRSLIRGVAYMVEKKGSDQSGFRHVLKKAGLEVRSKELIERADGSQKGNWDIAITVDAMNIAPRVDTVILFSGDGDFVDLLTALKARGIRVEVMSFRKSTANSLVEASTHYEAIGSDLVIGEKRFKITDKIRELAEDLDYEDMLLEIPRLSRRYNMDERSVKDQIDRYFN